MVILLEKGKIKSIARRVMSSHILGVWIPDYEGPWLGGRMPVSGSREPGFESSTYDGAVDGDTLWRQQNKILVIVLGNKLSFTFTLRLAGGQYNYGVVGKRVNEIKQRQCCAIYHNI